MSQQPPPPATGEPSTPGTRGLGRRTALSLVGAMVSAGLSFVMVVVVSRGLGAAGAGIFFVVTSLVVIVGGVAGLGTDAGLIYAVPRLLHDGHHASFRRQLLVALVPVGAASVLLALACFLFAEPFASVTGGRGTDVQSSADGLRVLVVVLALTPLYELLMAATRSLDHLTTTVVLDKLIRPVVQPLLVSVAVLAGASVPVVLLAWGAFYPFAAVAAGVSLSRLYRRKVGPHAAGEPLPTRELARGFWTFTGPRSASRIAQVVIQRIDIIIVASILTPAAAGVYGAVSRLVSTGLLVNSAMQQATQPRLSFLLAARRRSEALASYRLSTTWLMAATWPLFLIMVLFAPTILRVLFGAEFVVGSTALRILSVTMLAATSCGLVDVVLMMSGRSMISLFNTVTALVVNVGLDLLLIPRWGLTGAAIAWAAAILANNVLPLGQVWAIMGFHPFTRRTVAVVIGATTAILGPGLVALGLLGTGTASLVVGGGLGLAAYAAFAWQERDRLELSHLYREMRARRSRRAADGPAPGTGPRGPGSVVPSETQAT